MATIPELYCKGVRQQSKLYFAAWLPSTVLELGTVGVLQDRYFFDPKSSLGALGYDFDPADPAHVIPDDSPSPLKLNSGRTSRQTFKLGGEVSTVTPHIPQARAGIGLEFGAEGAFVIEAEETYEPRIRDIFALERWILAQHRAGAWERDWAVVTSLVTAPHASIVVSQSRSSKVELMVSGDAHVGSVELGRAGIDFQSAHTSGTVLNMANSRDVAPLFKLVGLQRKWMLGGSRPGTLSRDESFRVTRSDRSDDALEEAETGEYYVDYLGGYDLP
jgi:hypothetical protein